MKREKAKQKEENGSEQKGKGNTNKRVEYEDKRLEAFVPFTYNTPLIIKYPSASKIYLN